MTICFEHFHDIYFALKKNGAIFAPLYAIAVKEE